MLINNDLLISSTLSVISTWAKKYICILMEFVVEMDAKYLDTYL